MTVDIVIPSFNRGMLLAEAVESALAQSYPDTNVIVVDDGSTDAFTLRTLLALECRPRVTVLRQENRGAAAARNRGIATGTGEFILCLDDDDMIAPTYAEKAVRQFRGDQSVEVVYTHGRRFGAVNAPMTFPEITPQWLALGNCILQASFFRRSSWENLGGYRESFARGYEDYDFWIRLAAQGATFCKISEELVFYREGNNSLMRTIRADAALQDSLACEVYEANAAFFAQHCTAIYRDRLRIARELRQWKKDYSAIDRLLGSVLRRGLRTARFLKSRFNSVR